MELEWKASKLGNSLTLELGCGLSVSLRLTSGKCCSFYEVFINGVKMPEVKRDVEEAKRYALNRFYFILSCWNERFQGITKKGFNLPVRTDRNG